MKNHSNSSLGKKLWKNIDYRTTSTKKNPFLKKPFGKPVGAWVLAASRLLISQDPSIPNCLGAKALRSLENGLFLRFSFVLNKVMDFELAVARLKNNLRGDTPETRFEDFLKKTFWSPKLLKRFFSQYPKIPELLEQMTEYWIEFILELTDRFKKDSVEITSAFGFSRLGKIIDLQIELSDPHKCGKSVAILSFSSGPKLVYKPRNIKIEKAYDSLLSHLNRLGLSPAMKTIKILDKERYGWIEYVENKPCLDEAGIHRYYERVGIQLCLFYILRGTDAHYENSIASEEYPVIIDAETLFMPQFIDLKDPTRVEKFSVLYTTFLPQISFNYATEKAMEIGGLSMDEKNTSAFSLKWTNLGMDEMHLRLEEFQMPESKHRLSYQGKRLSAVDYQTDILRGFKNTYHFISKHKKDLLKPDGPLALMEALPVRVVMRNTQTYFNMLNRLTNPEFLGDPVLYEKELDLLSLSVKDLGEEFRCLIEAEKTAIRRGDIPIFYALPKSNTLLSETYSPLLARLFLNNAIGEVVSLIENMNPKEESLQIQYIQDAFAALRSESHDLSSSPGSITDQIPLEYSKDSIEDQEIEVAALDIAETILKHTDTDAKSLNWYAMDLIPSLNRYSFQRIGPGLYSGTAGIALFFSALSSVTQKPYWGEMGRKIIQPSLETMQKGDYKLLFSGHGIGGIIGMSSSIYILSHMAKLLKEPSLQTYAEDLVRNIPEDLIEKDKSFDIIIGSAGLILILLSLYQYNKSPEILEKAVRAGDHIIKHALTYNPTAVVWKTMESSELGLTGFSHGAAGIAYALLKLGHFSQERRFTDIAKKGIEYERLKFSAEHKNWPDFRKEPYGYSCAWCHGASGIGMGRIAGLPYWDDGMIREEIHTSLETTEKNLRWEMDHLCCGGIGQLELLRIAAKALEREDLQKKSLKYISWFIEKSKPEKNKLFFKLNAGSYHPGFFTGTSGIGYTLLSMHKKGQSLPRVALLD